MLVIIGVIGLGLSGCQSYNNNSEGVKFFSQSQYDQAVNSFVQAQKADSNNPDSYYNLAATYHHLAKISAQTNAALAKDQLDFAEKNYQLCLARDNNHTAAYRGLAVLYIDRQNPDAAFKLLDNWSKQSMSAAPMIEMARLFQEFAAIQAVLNQPAESQQSMQRSIIWLTSALEAEPNNARALRAMGYLREINGNTAEAINDYQRSLQSDPQQEDLKARIATLQGVR